ncbi:MAG: T9SS type A sorting domain-containing protein [bacterium]|nr:T9SS type A sorting domain-containing protein [bacterium]
MKLFLVLILLANIAFADPEAMPISVIAGGGARTANISGQYLRGTVGQTIAKRVVGASNTLRGGFWPTMRATLFAPVGDAQVPLPNRIEFHAAYPNPFNPSTSLSFSLPQTSEVSLKLFDITGRNVATLANGRYTAGSHSINWSADAFATGTYFARMQTGGYSHTQKLHLIK